MSDAICEKCRQLWKNIESLDDFPKNEWEFAPGEPTDKAKELEIDGFYKNLQIVHKKDNGRILFNKEFTIEV